MGLNSFIHNWVGEGVLTPPTPPLSYLFRRGYTASVYGPLSGGVSFIIHNGLTGSAWSKPSEARQ